MKRINIKTDGGKSLILYDDLKALIYIKEYSDKSIIDESLKLVNGKEISIISKEILDLKIKDKVLLYKRDNILSKSSKEIKINKLDVTSRSVFLNIYNETDYIKLDNIDVMDFIKEESAYLINYKHQNVGLIIYKDNIIDRIIISKCFRRKEIGITSLKKLLYKIQDEVYTYIKESNLIARSLFEKLDFLYQKDEYYIYEV